MPQAITDTQALKELQRNQQRFEPLTYALVIISEQHSDSFDNSIHFYLVDFDCKAPSLPSSKLWDQCLRLFRAARTRPLSSANSGRVLSSGNFPKPIATSRGGYILVAARTPDFAMR